MSPSLELTFVGHACFLLRRGNHRLLTDPYSTAIGYDAIGETVDVVTLSHLNAKYHSCLDDVKTAHVIQALEHFGQTATSGPFEISFIEVFDTLPDIDPNGMALIEVAGTRILHMGDCGHLPSSAQTEACGRVDVLLALAGAGPTLELPDLMRFVEAIQPKIVIPMHFGLPGMEARFAPVMELEKLWPGEIVRLGSHCQVSRESLPDEAQLWILQPLRLRA